MYDGNLYLYNEISNIIKKNSLFKLGINVNLFEDVQDLINKNLLSLNSFTITINCKNKIK